MSMMQMNANTQAPLTLAGDRIRGQPVRTQNVLACNTIANYVKSSLGPVGLDKMLVDDVGEVTITNDGATILKLLDIQDPAAKVQKVEKNVQLGNCLNLLTTEPLVRSLFKKFN